MHLAWSSGESRAGRVLEFGDKRLEQKNNQQMSEDMRSGGPLVDSRRPLQTDQALQPLEAKFNAPSQTIEGQNIGCRELFRRKRGHHNDPVRGVERLPGKLMTAPLRLPPRLATRLSRCLGRLLDGDQPQRQRRALLEFYPDR